MGLARSGAWRRGFRLSNGGANRCERGGLKLLTATLGRDVWGGRVVRAARHRVARQFVGEDASAPGESTEFFSVIASRGAVLVVGPRGVVGLPCIRLLFQDLGILEQRYAVEVPRDISLDGREQFVVGGPQFQAARVGACCSLLC